MASDHKMFDSDDIPTIPEFYRGRKIFITGGSGFMGKVLVEKLLRSCPDLDTIYLLLRPKKGKTPSSRVKVITDTPLFDRLKKENPSSLEKIIPVLGDVKELGLGLSEEDRDMLQNDVSIIFHSAASVKFDDPIRDAILINVRGTLEVVNLALGMTKLKALIHLSTTYSNCDRPIVYEEVYPAPGDWRRMIRIVEQNEDDHLLRCLTPKIMGTLPNTYTYAKSLGEHVIKDHQDKLPVVIVRPSIVTSSVSEPMAGWVDNFNGPTGLMMAGGKGLLRSVYADPNNIGDYVPVDVAIKSIIFIAWQRALSSDQPTMVPVYNCCSMTKPYTLYDVIKMALREIERTPTGLVMWAPNPTITSNQSVHYLKVIFFHLLPALLIDGLLVITGRKPMLIKLQRRIYIANMTLSVFTTQNNAFSNTNFRELQKKYMKSVDSEAFGYNEVLSASEEYFRTNTCGARLYLMKQSPSNLARDLRHSERMYWLDKLCKTLMLVLFLWVVWRSSLVQSALQRITRIPGNWDWISYYS